METLGDEKAISKTILSKLPYLKGQEKGDLEETLKFCELVFDITSLNQLKNGYSVYSLKPLHEIYNLITKSVFVTLLGDFKVGKSFILV
jgi:hypothetical protein